MIKTSRFNFCDTPIKGLLLVQRIYFEDIRGGFGRHFCIEEFQEAGISFPIVQINHSITCRRGSVRGMHFQFPPYAETKMVSCLKGEIFDVAVDLRQGSPTFLKCHAEILSASNWRSFVIPEGFAHGFQTLTENCELIYLHTKPYTPSYEGALNALDPRLAIEWPLQISELSERDRSHPYIVDEFSGVFL